MIVSAQSMCVWEVLRLDRLYSKLVGARDYLCTGQLDSTDNGHRLLHSHVLLTYSLLYGEIAVIASQTLMVVLCSLVCGAPNAAYEGCLCSANGHRLARIGSCCRCPSQTMSLPWQRHR